MPERAKSRFDTYGHESISSVPEEVDRIERRVSERRSRCGYSTLRIQEVASAYRVVEASLELTGTRRQRRELALRPNVYITSQFKKGRAEVSERQLDKEQLIQLRSAKEKEVDNYVRNAAIEAIAEEMNISVKDMMKMRWVITIKRYPDLSEKVKARLCILGFQDPDLE